MRKPSNLKDQILEPVCSLGAVLMSIVAVLIVLYGLTIAIRFIASFLV